jgi:hypothetical protein
METAPLYIDATFLVPYNWFNFTNSLKEERFMVNNAASLKKVAEVGEAVSSSMAAIDSFQTLIEAKLKQENEQKKSKPKVDESQSV